MITIDQLLESIDLDFEPRWVTRDECGEICIFEHKPETYESTREWVATVPACGLSSIGKIKLAEFANKHWTECIYEVPRKITGKIKKIEVYGTLSDYKFNPMGKFEPMTFMELIKKINELVDAVNNIVGAQEQIITEKNQQSANQ